MEQSYWQKSEEHLPRFWLELETENLLIPWETVQTVRASPDFLNLSFTYEFGHIHPEKIALLLSIFREFFTQFVELSSWVHDHQRSN